MDFSFKLLSQKNNARAGIMKTPHGDIPTPVYMPVGTLATVKALDSQDVEETKAPIILANTYHLYLNPKTDVLEKAGGLHNFMKWEKPILTDSGGFQVFSLGKAADEQRVQLNRKSPAAKQVFPVKITPDGVEFTSYLDGSKHFFSPEVAIDIQRSIGADIMMAFDECTPDTATIEYARQALDRTHRWAKRCKDHWEKYDRKNAYGTYQSLFGIVQGALHKDLRRESTEVIRDLDFDGIAIGGESIGYNMPATVETMDWIRDLLPEDKPRYAMGLGRDPQNIVDAVLAGYDMFDCVAPTRLARNGAVYNGSLKIPDNTTTLQHDHLPTFISEYSNGRLQIGNAQFKFDQAVIQPGCDCYTCASGYTRSYLRHLYITKELAYYRLASIHNVRFMIRLCEELRKWIVKS